MLYNVMKPLVILMAISLSSILIFQTISMTGFLTEELVPANVTIGNVAPTVWNVTCSSGVSDHLITPSPCQNVTVNCWALVTDLNGADDILEVEGVIGTDTSGKRACREVWQNARNCYYDANCTYDAYNATTRNYTCTFDSFRYFADVSWSMAKNNWSAYILANDSEEVGRGDSYDLEYVENLTAIDISEAFLNFGTMSLGQTSSNDSETNSTIKNCGNYAMYVNVSGTDLTCSDQGQIPVENLKYNGTFGTEYESDTSLTTSSTKIPYFLSGYDYIEYASDDEPGLGYGLDQVSWQLSIPATGVKGLCAGNITFYAIRV